MWCFLRDNDDLRTLLTFLIHKHYPRGAVHLAKKMGISNQRLSGYLLGKRARLTQHQLVKLADHFGIELELNISFRVGDEKVGVVSHACDSSQ